MMDRRQRQRSSPDRRQTAENEKSRRYFDARYGAVILKVLPGDYRLSGAADEMLVTVLGSCVAACVRNPATGYGGMNHFMLPVSSDPASWDGLDAALRYGNFAMEKLINEVLKNGCSKEKLEIKLFGGASVSSILTDVGERNIKFARQYMESEGLKITAEDLGGEKPRRIHYSPVTGKVQRLFLRRMDDRQIIDREENQYRRAIFKPKAVEGDVEIFD